MCQSLLLTHSVLTLPISRLVIPLNNISKGSNMVKNCDTCHDPDEFIFNFSSYNLNYHGKSVLYKGLNFAVPPKAIKYSELLLPFEMLVILINNASTVDSHIADTYHLNRFPRYLTKIFPGRR